MVGTSPLTKGGISSVIDVYRVAGLFDRWSIVYIASHIDGGRIAKLLYVTRAVLRYAGFLLAGRVELVHIHSASNASFWRKTAFALMARLAHKPVIFHLHGGGFLDFFQKECNRFEKIIVRLVLDSASCIIVQSEFWKTCLEDITHNKHIVPIPNPVITHACDAQKMAGREQNIVLFLARISEEKGIYDLLEAIARIIKSGRDVVLKIVGDGELSEVRRRIEKLGIHEHVQILGWTTGQEKQTLLAKSTVFALPSYVEGLPMGLLEAMAAGLPVVASRVGAIPEVIQDGTSGFLVDPGDINGLADSVEKLLVDVELRKKFSTAANNKILMRFGVKQVLPRLEDLYHQLGAEPKH